MTSKNEVKKEGRIMHFIETKIAPLAIKMSQQIHLKSIMSAFLSCMPFMIIGSFALILWEPPVDYSTLASTNILYGFFKGWSNFAAFADPALNLIFSYTLGSLSFYVAIGVSYFLSKNYKLKPYLPVAVTGMVFFMLNTSFIEGGLSTSYFDGTGLFAAMLVSILSTEFYRVLIENKVGSIKMPDGVPSALANSFEALVPVIIMASAAAILSVLILNISGTTLPALVLMAISPIVKFIDNVFGVSFIALLQNVLWWFGIHDTAIGSVISPIRDANIAMNAAAYAGGTAATNLPYVFTSPFWWVFCQIGGTGSTFGLCILLLCSRSKQLKEVGKLAIVPAFFNINEPILFGIPIVLNPLWFAPFVFTQIFNAASTYLVMQMNLINRTFIEPGWNLFAPFGAYFSTLDFRAVIFILILMVVDTLIYLPFFKVQEKICIKEELEMKTETVQSEME